MTRERIRRPSPWAASKAAPAPIKKRETEGRFLEPGERAPFESRFDFDFSKVRVHEQGPLADLAGRQGILAVTAGHDVGLAPAMPPLDSTLGQHVLAHELAHVVQQSPGGGASLAGADGDPAALEREASRAADAFLGRDGPVEVLQGSQIRLAAYQPDALPEELEASSQHGGTPVDPGEEVTLLQLLEIMPQLSKATPDQRQYYLDMVNDAFEIFEIDTVESRAFFLAHASVESKDFGFLEEADFRQAYRTRDPFEEDPSWRPGVITAAQAADFKGRGYDTSAAISPPSSPYRNIGRGPLMVTTGQGYFQALRVLEAWGQQLGQRGQIEEASRVLHAVGELRRDRALAAKPEYGFLLSAAHFKAVGVQSGRAGVTKLGLDLQASRNRPKTVEQFFQASARMHGTTEARLKKMEETSPRNYKIHIDNRDAKFAVYQRALNVLDPANRRSRPRP